LAIRSCSILLANLPPQTTDFPVGSGQTLLVMAQLVRAVEAGIPTTARCRADTQNLGRILRLVEHPENQIVRRFKIQNKLALSCLAIVDGIELRAAQSDNRDLSCRFENVSFVPEEVTFVKSVYNMKSQHIPKSAQKVHCFQAIFHRVAFSVNHGTASPERVLSTPDHKILGTLRINLDKTAAS
jgi:hypothetical protein